MDPLTRPYRLAAIRQAALDQDTAALSPSGRRALGWLTAELDAAADSTAVVAELGASAYHNGRRDSFREGGGEGGGASGGIWASVARGPLVAVINPAFENRLKDDPEFTGKKNRSVAGRLQSGYVAVTGGIGDAGIGRMARQWGPAPFDGLQLSPMVYAMDELWAAIRVGRFELSTIAQRLDDHVDSTVSADPINRYFMAHRLTVRAGRGVWLAFTETGVYGGPGRGFEPAFLAPLNPALITEFNERRQINLLWGAQASVRVSSRLTLAGEAVIDDIQVDDTALTDKRPWSGGFTLTATGSLPAVPVHATLGYTRVRSLTYRNSLATFEVYSAFDVGIGRNFSDYDQVMLRLETRPSSHANIGLDASYLRQGSGDFRQPFPPDSVLAQPGQGFLVAPSSSAGAFRVWGSIEMPRGIMLRAQLGRNGSVTGASETIAQFSVSARFDVLRGAFGSPWPGVE